MNIDFISQHVRAAWARDAYNVTCPDEEAEGPPRGKRKAGHARREPAAFLIWRSLPSSRCHAASLGSSTPHEHPSKTLSRSSRASATLLFSSTGTQLLNSHFDSSHTAAANAGVLTNSATHKSLSYLPRVHSYGRTRYTRPPPRALRKATPSSAQRSGKNKSKRVDARCLPAYMQASGACPRRESRERWLREAAAAREGWGGGGVRRMRGALRDAPNGDAAPVMPPAIACAADDNITSAPGCSPCSSSPNNVVKASPSGPWRRASSSPCPRPRRAPTP